MEELTITFKRFEEDAGDNGEDVVELQVTAYKHSPDKIDLQFYNHGVYDTITASLSPEHVKLLGEWLIKHSEG